MKKFFLLLSAAFSFTATSLRAQQEPIRWTASYKSSGAGEGEIVIVAAIEKSWHIYSQNATADGPVPTSFTFPQGKNYELQGKPTEIGAHELFDKTFDARISSFSDKAEFRQKIKYTRKPGFSIPFKVEFMSCNDMMCLPPKTVDLSVKIQ